MEREGPTVATTPIPSTFASRGLRRLTHRQQEVIWAYAFLLPAIFGLIVFTIGPAVASFVFAFLSTNLITVTQWVGAGNFLEMLADDVFWASVRNTLIYVVGQIPPATIFALGLAIALNQGVRGRAVFRTIYFLPVVAPIVSTSLVWAWAYQTEFGVFNYVLKALGFQAIPWLTSSDYALYSVILWAIWAGMGYDIILFLAALQSVPQELVEAAKLDGASTWNVFWNVTMPMISPTTFFIVVLSIIGAFQVFTQTYVLTGGGPGHATYTIVMYLYKLGWSNFRFGYASAVAVLLCLVLAIITAIQFRAQRNWVYYEHD